jgi:LysR family transcriptional regulator (chromosome initiation inhibitor)
MPVDLDPDQLRALAAVVSAGTFDAAATRLQVTPSAISQRIKALESRTGRVLVRRTRPVVATESGEVLLRAARQLELVAADVADGLGTGPSAPRLPIALAVNADSLATWLLPAVAAVATELILALHREDETRTAALLRDGSVMAAVTAAREPVSGCTVRRLGAMRYRPCAAPRFIARWLSGNTAEELACAPLVDFDGGDQIQDRWLRRATRRRRLDPPRHLVPGSEAFVQAIALGLGWGMVPDLQSERLLNAGELVLIGDGRPLDIPLYWQQWRLRSAPLERVAEAVRAGAAAALV